MYISVVPCSDKDFETVKKGIQKMELDNRALSSEQFIIAKDNSNNVLGFGRERVFDQYSELCTIGVFSNYRNRGIGKAITNSLINYSASKKLYVVTIIPKYFEYFGFSITHQSPQNIQDKLYYCLHSLPVAQPYYIMER